MIEQKCKLPNGNLFIWLGNQPIHDCDNVLLLYSDDVLFLKTTKKESGESIRRDINRLGKEKFLDKYGWPHNASGDDLYWELKSLPNPLLSI